MGMVINVDGTLEELMHEFTSQSSEETKKRVKNEQTKWIMPPKKDWDGDLSDWAGIYKAFDTDQLNKDLLRAVEPDVGNNGDLILGNTQIDYLSMVERAFRARHTMTFPRNVAHHCSRKDGQGQQEGPFSYGVVDYLRQIDKVSKRIV